MKLKGIVLLLLVAGISAGYGWKKFSNQPNISTGATGRPSMGGNNIEVATQLVAAKEVATQLSFMGNLKAKQAVTLAAQINAVIKSIDVSSGQQVKKNQILVVLDSTKAQASVDEANALFADEKRKLTELTKLHGRGALTKTELEAQQTSADIAKAKLTAAQAVLKDHQIIAPFDGTVGLIDISRGQLVAANSALLDIDDLSAMELDINVPEKYLSQLKQNITITASSNAWPEHVFTGKFATLDSKVNKDSLNIRMRIDIANTQHLLRPGMLMEAKLTLASQKVAVIPTQAIEYSGTKRFVYRVNAEGKAIRTEVVLGARYGNLIAVDAGLAIGDKIVVQGLVNMRDGISVSEFNSPTTNASEGN